MYVAAADECIRNFAWRLPRVRVPREVAQCQGSGSFVFGRRIRTNPVPMVGYFLVPTCWEFGLIEPVWAVCERAQS